MKTSSYSTENFAAASSRRRLVARAATLAAAAALCLLALAAIAPLAQARKINTTYTVYLGPATASNPIGVNHTLTATVFKKTTNCDPEDGKPFTEPLSGATVKFEVTSGPNKGLTGTGTTDPQGHATFTYTSMKPGTDNLVATLVGLKDVGACLYDSGPAPSKEVEAIWLDRDPSGGEDPPKIDDGLPQITISDVRVTEGNSDLSPATPARFTVSLSKASAVPVTVDYATADGSATMPADYVGEQETLTFAPGDPLTQDVTIDVRGDHLDEADETFEVDLSNATNAQIADPLGIGTILDDDGPPML